MKSMFIAITMIFLASTAWGATFTNGGFETGNFTGWTLGGGTWDVSPMDAIGPWTQTYNATGDPGKSAIVTPGADTGGSGSTLTPLNRVYDGSYAARINNFDDYNHYSTLSQTVANFTDAKIYIAWRTAVEGDSRGHPDASAPKFSVNLTDLTSSTILYNVAFNHNNAGSFVTWSDGTTTSNGTWSYSPWQYIEIDTSGIIGDTIKFSLEAYDCGFGSHGGYAYVDYVGNVKPDLPPTGGTEPVPEPSTMLLLGSGLAGLLGYGRRRFKK